MATRTELGCPGHLIVASSCRWRRHTQVGHYRISTIGDYWLPEVASRAIGEKPKRQTLGASADSFFETMVFETTDQFVDDSESCGCYEVKDWGGIDQERYATAGEAQIGHERYVAKYMKELD